MRILFIAPLPPPLTGHSLAAQHLLNALRGKHSVDVVDLSIGSSHDGAITVRRLIEVVKVIASVAKRRRRQDVIYLTISESLAGNLKDVAIYALCRRRLSSMYIHLHGGSIGVELFERHRWLKKLNAHFVRGLGGVIVTGDSHTAIFSNMISPDRIHVVANFAPEELFASAQTIEDKFAHVQPLRVLYLSGMNRQKGYEELLEAYLSLPPESQRCIQVDFAGKFERRGDEDAFRRRIEGVKTIAYHGFVEVSAKRLLLERAHVLCLPTGYSEGQPIAILEAYASGCVVLTTPQKGILDVFAPGQNGFAIAKSPESIAKALQEALGAGASLRRIALLNRRIADTRFRPSAHLASIQRVLGASAA